MTWEELVETVKALAPAMKAYVKYSTEEIEIGEYEPAIFTRRGDVYVTFWSEELTSIWIAWGEYCKTLKAEMDRCSGGGVCSRSVKVEIKS